MDIFSQDADLRLRMRPLLMDNPHLSATELAQEFLDSLDDDEYNRVIEVYVSSLIDDDLRATAARAAARLRSRAR